MQKGCLIWHRGTIDELNFSEWIEQIDSRTWRKKILASRRKSVSCTSRDIAIIICQLFTGQIARRKIAVSWKLPFTLSVTLSVCFHGYLRCDGVSLFHEKLSFSRNIHTSTKVEYIPSNRTFFRWGSSRENTQFSFSEIQRD